MASPGVEASVLQRLSPLLDEAMDLDPARQEQWLQALPPDVADLAPILRRMLFETGNDDWLTQGAAASVLGTDCGDADFQPGSSVGAYTLLSLIGQGGMGDVWLAERTDGLLRRQVALKLPVLGLRKRVLAQRLERERDILAALNHPHIARLYDAGISRDGQPYLALEYVEGVSITAYAQQHNLDARARVDLLVQVIGAMQYAHSNMVIHRDLKPANVLVNSQGDVKLLDFGIAKLVQEGESHAHKTELTQLGGRALTAHYASPEQWRGLPVSTATDIWSLGILLYELLADTLPFDGHNRSELEHAILERDPHPASACRSAQMRSLSRELATDLDTIVLKALRKEAAQRYVTANAMAEDLQRWESGEPVLARPDGMWYRMRKLVGRHRWKVATGVVTMVALGITTALATAMSWRAQEHSHRAMAARDFLINMFRLTDPDLSQGRDVSARELLTQGHQTIIRTLAHQPLLQAELLLGIGEAQSSMEDYAAADEAFGRAATLLQGLGQHREAAHAYLDRAFLAVDALESGEKGIEWLSMARRVHGSEQADPPFAARALVIEMVLAFLRADSSAQEALIRQVQPIAADALRGTSARVVQAVRNLAEGEGQIGQYPTAIDRLSKLLQRLQLDPTTAPSLVLGIEDDLAELEFNAGNYRASMLRYEDANRRCLQQLNPKGSQCDFTQYGRARVLLHLGMVKEALQTLPNLLTPAKGWQSTKVVRAYHLLDRAGRLQEFPDVQQAVKAIGAGTYADPVPARTRFNALLMQSEHFLRQRQSSEVQKLIAEAQSFMLSSGLSAWYLHAHLLKVQGLAAQLNGDFGTAMTLLGRSTALESHALGTNHPAYHLSAVHQVRAIWASGRFAQAHALLNTSLPHLELAMGADAPVIKALRQLRKDIARPMAMHGAVIGIEIFN